VQDLCQTNPENNCLKKKHAICQPINVKFAR
jgi:hypothetical protein